MSLEKTEYKNAGFRLDSQPHQGTDLWFIMMYPKHLEHPTTRRCSINAYLLKKSRENNTRSHLKVILLILFPNVSL